MKIYPKGSKVWSEKLDVNISSVEDVIKLYESGYSAIYRDPDEQDKFNEVAFETGGFVNAEDAGNFFGWSDNYAGQLAIPFTFVLEAYPGCWPGKAQPVGDCVSRSNTNSVLGVLCCEVASGVVDEETGILETYPEVSQLGIENGVLASEPIYWFRGHGSHGWDCSSSARHSIQNTAAVLRQNFPDININLTTYTKSNIERYGRTPPPQNIRNAISNNRIRTAARVSDISAIRDNLCQGRFIHTCGSEGFARPRNEHGVSNRSGSWAHAVAYIGFDDRPEIVRMYKGPLILILNSWGNYNSGNRDIFDSAKFVPPHKKELWISIGLVNSRTGNIMIPNGSFWCRASDVRNRTCFVFAGLNGWKAQKIPTWGVDLWG